MKKKKQVCPVCMGNGSVDEQESNYTCEICHGSGEQPPEWDRACKLAGVPPGDSCHGLKKNCKSLKHDDMCTSTNHGTSHLPLSNDGKPMKYGSCLRDVSERVLKIRAKKVGSFSIIFPNGESTGDLPMDALSAENKPLIETLAKHLGGIMETAKTNTTNVKPCKRDLPVTLTDAELLSLSRDNAKAFNDQAELRKRLDEVKAEYKAKENGYDAMMQKANRLIQNGYEHREVKCEWQYDWDNSRKTCIRLDTMAVVETREIDSYEYQKELPLADA